MIAGGVLLVVLIGVPSFYAVVLIGFARLGESIAAEKTVLVGHSATSADGRFVASWGTRPAKRHPDHSAQFLQIEGGDQPAFRSQRDFCETWWNYLCWAWAEDSPLWMYNSDDGRFWQWTLGEDGWVELEHSDCSAAALAPPLPLARQAQKDCLASRERQSAFE